MTAKGAGAIAWTTSLSILLGFALHSEGISTFLTVVLAIIVWWIIALLYDIRNRE